MDKMQGTTMLEYKNYRHFKATSLLVVMAVAAYVLIEPAGGESYGGTWLGYVLGIISTLIILWQMWYGITKRCTPGSLNRRLYPKSDRRKLGDGGDQAGLTMRQKALRRHHPAENSWLYGGTLQGWLSAHIYMGASLIVLVTLHAGFRFGWNVHTLPYVLLLMVIASGFYGTYAYLNYPRLITLNMGEDTLDGLLLKIAELDEMARIRALGLPDEVNALVLKAREKTRLGGNLFQQLSGEQRDCPTRFAVQQLHQLSEKYNKDDQPKSMRDLYAVLLRKEKLVLRTRNEIMLKARLDCWLYLHAPLAVGLLAALIAHIVAIFFYW